MESIQIEFHERKAKISFVFAGKKQNNLSKSVYRNRIFRSMYLPLNWVLTQFLEKVTQPMPFLKKQKAQE